MPTAFLQVQKENSINIVELKLPTTLDSTEFDQLNDAFADLLNGAVGGGWILDLSGLTYLGSSAWA